MKLKIWADLGKKEHNVAELEQERSGPFLKSGKRQIERLKYFAKVRERNIRTGTGTYFVFRVITKIDFRDQISVKSLIRKHKPNTGSFGSTTLLSTESFVNKHISRFFLKFEPKIKLRLQDY
jgi:hypothetical protein